MGSRLVKYEFSPKENEQIEAVIKIPEENRSVMHGVVVDCRNKPIRNAVVKLLEILPGNPARMRSIAHTFTDDWGQFLFGPLYCNKKYALKVWYSDVKIRELIISPDCDGRCDDEYPGDYSNDDHIGDEHSEDYQDGDYEGHCDIDFGDYFGCPSDDECDEHDYPSDYDYQDARKDDNRYEQRLDGKINDQHFNDDRGNRKINEKRRDRHSDDDQYIHYRAPKVYGQKCSKCEVVKNKVNNFEEIEK